MPTTPLIAYTHVGKTFDGGPGAARVRAVDDVSLEVAEGEFLAIVGGSGSGKTTLLRLANRLIDADSGSITIEGEEVRAADPVRLRRRIGYVFQSGGLFPHISVAGNIGITPKLLGTPAAEISARVDELLDLVRLDRGLYRDRLPHELSGGQRQRVGVARALAARPRIVLMDEPFGALDPLTRDALGDDYRALHQKLGLTTVMITHDMTEAILLADRVAVMRAGRLLAQGTPSELSDSRAPYVAARNHPLMRGALLGLASIVQTVPGLALLALFYPLLLALAAITLSWFGFGFSAFGFLPAVLALALYSMLPVLRNTITGLRGVDPAILDAAQGVGMTPRQSLLSVELPLALPVMMAGIRTSAVWVIGTATLSTPIGQTSLGNYIFAGLQTQNWVFVLFGCLAAAVLALAVDQLLALIETGVRARSRLRVISGGIGIAALVAATLVPSMARSPSSYIVGAKTFAEQYVLSALIAQRLHAAGLSASSREGLGSNVIFEALASNDIDVYVDYSGTLWANQFHHTDIKPREVLLGELKTTLARQKITLLGELGFENAYALVMPRKRAEQLGIRSIADLASHAGTMSIAADYEFFSRPEWTGLQKAYGLTFRTQRQMQPDFMYAAVASGEVEVIAGYTSDGLIAKYDLVVLDDAKHAIPPYDAIVLIAPKRASDQALQAALRPLLDRIDISAMREANLRAAGGDGASSPDAGGRWPWEKSR